MNVFLSSHTATSSQHTFAQFGANLCRPRFPPITKSNPRAGKSSLSPVQEMKEQGSRSTTRFRDPEERYPQAGTHDHNFAIARLAQRPEFVRGGSSWTFLPKVGVGVAP